jgi:hypothetical protein
LPQHTFEQRHEQGPVALEDGDFTDDVGVGWQSDDMIEADVDYPYYSNYGEDYY